MTFQPGSRPACRTRLCAEPREPDRVHRRREQTDAVPAPDAWEMSSRLPRPHGKPGCRRLHAPHDRREQRAFQQPQLVREVAGGPGLRSDARPARGPESESASLGAQCPDREHQLVPDRLHEGRRCPRVRAGIAPAPDETRAGCRRGCPGREPERVAHRVAWRDLARCVPAHDSGNAGLGDELLSAPHGDVAGGHTGHVPAGNLPRTATTRRCSGCSRGSRIAVHMRSRATRFRVLGRPDALQKQQRLTILPPNLLHVVAGHGSPE